MRRVLSPRNGFEAPIALLMRLLNLFQDLRLPESVLEVLTVDHLTIGTMYEPGMKGVA